MGHFGNRNLVKTFSSVEELDCSALESNAQTIISHISRKGCCRNCWEVFGSDGTRALNLIDFTWIDCRLQREKNTKSGTSTSRYEINKETVSLFLWTKKNREKREFEVYGESGWSHLSSKSRRQYDKLVADHVGTLSTLFHL